MILPKPNDYYALLALFLSPWKNSVICNDIARYIEKEKIDWNLLFYIANVHLCTPLWHFSLKRDGFLERLPEEMQRYLEYLHEENKIRQTIFKNEVSAILAVFNEANISTLLLKGAATFADDLYGDPGVRIMMDADLLIPESQIEIAFQMLLSKGYTQDNKRISPIVKFILKNEKPHHLALLRLPNTPVNVELHRDTVIKPSGRILPTDLSWEGAEAISLAGNTTSILCPTDRVLHCLVHALVPQRIYANSILMLCHLAELAFLAKRYENKIDWEQCVERCTSYGWGRPLRIYLSLADQLMGVPIPIRDKRVRLFAMHKHRICVATNILVANAEPCFSFWQSICKKFQNLVRVIHIKLYWAVSSIDWAKNNICYGDGWRSIPLYLHSLTFRIVRKTKKVLFQKLVNSTQ